MAEASTVSRELRCGYICISGYYTLSRWTVAMAKLDKAFIYSFSLPRFYLPHTESLFISYPLYYSGVFLFVFSFCGPKISVFLSVFPSPNIYSVYLLCTKHLPSTHPLSALLNSHSENFFNYPSPLPLRVRDERQCFGRIKILQRGVWASG